MCDIAKISDQIRDGRDQAVSGRGESPELRKEEGGGDNLVKDSEFLANFQTKSQKAGLEATKTYLNFLYNLMFKSSMHP